MTTDRSILGSLVAAFDGLSIPSQIEEALAGGLGGVVLLARNVETHDQLREVTDAIHCHNPQALVMVDEEGGAVSRLDRVTGGGFPSAQALGFIDDPDLTRELAAIRGGYLRACGVDLCLAPVADLRRQPENPVVGSRSFGEDSELVARHVKATVVGTRLAGVAACVKHFPGHGATDADSHESWATAAASEAAIRRDHLIPFRTAVDAGVEAVMPGHIVVPEWDARPASISSKALVLLRAELSFDGLIVSDAVDMAGVGSGVEVATADAIAAGADLILLGNREPDQETIESIVASIRDALADGFLSRERLREAAYRRAAFGRPPVTAEVRLEDRRAEAARRAISWHGEAIRGPSRVRTVVVARPSWTRGLEIDDNVTDSVRAAFPAARVVVDGEELASDADLIVTNDSAFDPTQVVLVARIRSTKPSTLVAETGLLAGELTPPVVQLRGASELSMLALARELEGTSP